MGRSLILHPALNPNSFVLLFARGDDDKSWSVRDYSVPARVSLRYAKDFCLTLRDLQRQAHHVVAAPSVSTGDIAFWHHHTKQINLEHEITASPANVSPPMSNSEINFPVYDPRRFHRTAKSRKTQDMRRIHSSANSEDWVTWNAFALLEAFAPDTWWKHLLQVVGEANALAAVNLDTTCVPTVSLWRLIDSPSSYEKRQRERMRESQLAAAVARSYVRRPVEGKSEIDIILGTPSATVFIEAKLCADISSNTTHDPSRNQIVRNIDCLIDTAGDTIPVFWMLVRDNGTMRSYVQLLNMYRIQPSLLEVALPHRAPELLRSIAHRLTSVLWKDLISVLPPFLADQEAYGVLRELNARVL